MYHLSSNLGRKLLNTIFMSILGICSPNLKMLTQKYFLLSSILLGWVGLGLVVDTGVVVHNRLPILLQVLSSKVAINFEFLPEPVLHSLAIIRGMTTPNNTNKFRAETPSYSEID